MRYFFAWLGSKRAVKREVPEPGCLLDKAAANNLPVPSGGILLHNFYELALEEGVIQVEDGLVTAVSAPALHDLLFNLARFPLLDVPMVVRPLHPNQIGPALSPVQLDNPTQLSSSLCEGWTTQNGRHDLLLISLPENGVRGTAFPQNATTDQASSRQTPPRPCPASAVGSAPTPACRPTPSGCKCSCAACAAPLATLVGRLIGWITAVFAGCGK
ncbi:MAG: hypothetical protein H6656_01405 [Ardenticatenaceae bacterium]|nr:hypothetical protein [Ardenticatenaceae bacterium]